MPLLENEYFTSLSPRDPAAVLSSSARGCKPSNFRDIALAVRRPAARRRLKMALEREIARATDIQRRSSGGNAWREIRGSRKLVQTYHEFTGRSCSRQVRKALALIWRPTSQPSSRWERPARACLWARREPRRADRSRWIRSCRSGAECPGWCRRASLRRETAR